MRRYTKAQKKKLRELAGIANERELYHEMEKLSLKVFTFTCSGKL